MSPPHVTPEPPHASACTIWDQYLRTRQAIGALGLLGVVVLAATVSAVLITPFMTKADFLSTVTNPYWLGAFLIGIQSCLCCALCNDGLGVGKKAFRVSCFAGALWLLTFAIAIYTHRNVQTNDDLNRFWTVFIVTALVVYGASIIFLTSLLWRTNNAH